MPGTISRLLLSDQASQKVKPLVLYIQAYQPKMNNQKQVMKSHSQA